MGMTVEDSHAKPASLVAGWLNFLRGRAVAKTSAATVALRRRHDLTHRSMATSAGDGCCNGGDVDDHGDPV